MNSRQELIDAINREHDGPAPPAIFTQSATVPQMEISGCYWPEAHFDADSMAILSTQPSLLYGFATARLPFDVTISEERLGCQINVGCHDRPPSIIGSPWRNADMSEVPDFMPVEEFMSGGRVAVILEAAEKVRKYFPHLFLTTGLAGPVSLVSSLAGMENFLITSLTYPDVAEKWIRKVTPYLCEYAKQLSEKSDNVVVMEDAEEDILAPDQLSMFVEPYIPQIMKSIGSSFSTLHTCGNTRDILEILAGMGENILSVETKYDPSGVLERVGDKVILASGIHPVADLMMGTPEIIVQKAKDYSDLGYPIIAPECGIPPQTSGTNMMAFSHYRGD